MSKKDRVFILVIVGLGLITCAVYLFVEVEGDSLWPGERVEADSGQRIVMGTFARVVAVAADLQTANRCIDAAFAEIVKVDELMSNYKQGSEISEVNREGFSRAVVVSESTFEVLTRAVKFSVLSGGAFDVTVGPLVELWRSAQESDSVPSEGEVEKVISRVGYDKLILDANEMTVRFAAEGMRLDLGGIAKGYAVDRAVEAMQRNGAIGGMVDIGGDIRCFGAPPRGKKQWRIGLRDARKSKYGSENSRLLMVLALTNASVATSGDYEQFVVVGGKRYSHIIDTKTGRGSDELTSVTIIGRTATDADALATAVSVMGVERGLALIEKLEATEAILVSQGPEYAISKSSGAGAYIE